VLFALHREPRRALLPVLPTALAAGWAPLVVLLLGRIPRVGDTLGAFNPLTVVLGALVIALGTEFGVVLLGRFYEERARGLGPDSAPAGAGSRRRIERRPATVDKPASWAPPAGDEAAPLAEPDLEPSVEPAARPELVPWAPPGEDEPAPLAEPAVRGRSEPEP